jgi:putative transposase
MQVIGLPRHAIRMAQSASRLLGAKTPHIEAQRRRDAVARWRRAMADGLTADKAARAVGISRATLYRWQADTTPRSRRPHHRRRPNWTPTLVRAVEDLRADNPMWGKRKLAALLRREGIAVSVSTVGRILRKLMDRGVVVPVPTLRRNPHARRIRLTARQRYARRLPKGLKPTRPGEIVQIDTLFVNVRPDRPIKHFTAGSCPRT